MWLLTYGAKDQPTLLSKSTSGTRHDHPSLNKRALIESNVEQSFQTQSLIILGYVLSDLQKVTKDKQMQL